MYVGPSRWAVVTGGATTVSLPTAYPDGGGDPNLLPLLNLEIWGLPTSQPAYDPTNHDYVYRQFERGVLQFDMRCGCTHGILLAATFKEVLLGQAVPADVAAELAGSPYLKLYAPAEMDGVAHVLVATANGTFQTPRVEGWTDLAFALVPG